MWRRWSGNNQPSQIGWPTDFHELDHEERYLETIPEVDSISSKRQSAVVTLPSLPFRAVPPMEQRAQPLSSNAPPSSDEHLDPRDLRIDTAHAATRHSEVSPLSPQSSLSRRRPVPDNRPISPLEPSQMDSLRGAPPDRNFQSHLPRPSPSTSRTQDKSQTKWDSYSGEPTNDDNGVASSIRPGTQPVELQYPQLKERTKQILAGLRDRDTSRKTPWGKQPPPVAPVDPLDQPVQRVPWRGASGRTALVEPVKNTPSARQGPVHYPQRNVSLANAHKEAPPTAETLPTTVEYYEAVTDVVPLSSPEDKTIRPVESQESIKPIVPLKTSKRPMSPVLEPDTMRGALQPDIHGLEPLPLSIPAHTEPVVQPRMESPSYDVEPPTPPTPQTPTPVAEPEIVDSAEDTPEPFRGPNMEHETSRFSWTTYDTSVPESPTSLAQRQWESSPPPPLPDMPSSIMIRKRPVPSVEYMTPKPYLRSSPSHSTASIVSRKPLPKANRATSATSATKDLPPVPDELSAADKMESLEATLSTLERRRHNISRIIRDLEQSLKKNAVTYDMWKRRDVERTIKDQTSELDTITQEMHEIGIQIHRVQRKRDREVGYEQPTGLWIRRVTS